MLVAQITENGLDLGGLFNGLRVNVDSYSEIIDSFKKIESFDDYFDLESGTYKWNDISEAIGGADEHAISYFKTLDNGNGVINNSSASIDGMSAHLKSTGQAFSFAAIKATLLNTALNAGIFLAVSFAIQGVAKAIDNYIHRVEIAREKAEEAKSTFEEINNTFEKQKQTVEDLADRYSKLQKGVKLSNGAIENNSLSTDEYEEFLNINEQLADTFPSLITGIDKNGESILNLGTSGVTARKQLEELLETEQEIANFEISQGIGDAFKGVLTYIDEANEASKELTDILNGTNEQIGVLQDFVENGIDLKQDNFKLFSGEINDAAITNYAYALQSVTDDFLNSLSQDRRLELLNKGLDVNGLFTMVNDDLTGTFDFYANLYSLNSNEIKTLEKLIESNVSSLNGTLRDRFSDNNKETKTVIDRAKNEWRDFIPSLIATMKSKATFGDLSADMKDVAVEIVEGLDYNFATEMKNYNPNDPYAYIRDKLIVPMSELPEEDQKLLSRKISDLLTLDKENLTKDNQLAINNLIDDIAKILGETPIDFRIAFGFDIENNNEVYQNAFKETREKLKGISNSYDEKGFLVKAINEEGKLLEDFWSENVKTLNDVEYWKKVTEGAETATEAIEKYNKAKNSQDDNTSKLPSQIKSLQDLSEGFEKLDKLYADIKDGGSFDYGNLADDKFIEIFSGYTEEYNNFIKVVSSSPNNINACQDAFNNLIGAWLKGKGTLEDLDEETLQVTRDFLENMGLTNASKIAIDNLEVSISDLDTSEENLAIQQQILSETGKELSDVSAEEAFEILEKGNASDFTRTCLANLILEEIKYNNSKLDVSQRISALQDLALAYGEVGISASMANAMAYAGGIADKDAFYNYYYNQLKEAFSTFKPDFKPTYGGGKKTQDGSGSGSSKDPKAYDDHREYFDYYDEELSTKEKFIDNFIAENDRLDRKFEKALEDSDFVTGEILKDKLNAGINDTLEALAKNANDARYVLNEDIMPKLRDIASQYGFDWSGLSIAEISDTEIEKVRQALQNDINIQKDIGVDMQNAETGDNAKAIKDAEMALQMFDDLNKSAESYYDKVGTQSGEGEWGAEYLELETKILENNLKYQEARSEYLQDQSDDIEHQIDLQRNAFNGDDVSNEFIKNEIALRKQQQEIAHQDAESWREYYRALGYTEDAIEKTAEVQEAQKTWWEHQQQIFDSYQEVIDKATKAMDERVETLEYEYEQENLIIDALEKRNELQRQLREEQRELRAEYEATQDIIAITGDDGTLFNKEDYDTLAKEIKSIDREITSLYEDYRDSINALSEDEWYKQEEITNEFERQQEALLAQYKIAEKQLELTKQRTKLENVINNKNKRTLIGGKWQNTSDLKAVYEERKNLIALEDEEYELRKESAENKHISALRKLNDSTNTEAKAVQHRIDMINEMTAEERKALAEELLKVEDMDDILNGLNEGALPKLVKVIESVIDNLSKLGDVEVDRPSSGGGTTLVPNIVNGKQDGSFVVNSDGKIEDWKMYHTGRVRELTPDEEKAILLKNETVLTKPQATDLAERLIEYEGLLKNISINPPVLVPNITLPSIPNITRTNTNTDNSQIINLYGDFNIKEPIQDMASFMDSVLKEANLYHLRTKNIR